MYVYFHLLDINDFSDVWMDFRIGIISKYIYKQHYIFKNSFTYYRQSEQNISSKYKFLSKKWWRRRQVAHDYVNFFFRKNQIKFNKNLDYYITRLVNKIYEV